MAEVVAEIFLLRRLFVLVFPPEADVVVTAGEEEDMFGFEVPGRVTEEEPVKGA